MYLNMTHLENRTTTALHPLTRPLGGSMDFVKITYGRVREVVVASTLKNVER